MFMKKVFDNYLDDIFYATGALLVTAGAYCVYHVAALFVAGAFCLHFSWLVGKARSNQP